LATPYGTVVRIGDRPAEHRQIEEMVMETGATLVIVGLPLSLEGSIGPAARSMLREVRALQRSLSVPVRTHDERMTTITAENNLARGGVKGRKRRQVVDQVAASVILQSWLDGQD
jgi:putative Holliday junction resolvase